MTHGNVTSATFYSPLCRLLQNLILGGYAGEISTGVTATGLSALIIATERQAQRI